MKKLIAKLFDVYTWDELQEAKTKVLAATKAERKEYYEKVLVHLQRTGGLPPNCDLKLPKHSMVVTIEDKVVAEDGKWKELPADNAQAVITYKKS